MKFSDRGSVSALEAATPEKNMRMPDERLEDFMSGIVVTPKAAEPPAMRWLRFTGEFEVLKPLVESEELVEDSPAIAAPLVSPTVSPEAIVASWGRSLALAGSFAIVALVLAAGIFIAIYRPRVEPVTSRSDVAADRQSEDIPAQPDQQVGDIVRPESDLSDPLIETNSPPVSDVPRALRSVSQPRPRVFHAVYRSRSVARPPQITETGFVPTTLVIYVEKGEIKSRIEPQLTSGYKKPVALPN